MLLLLLLLPLLAVGPVVAAARREALEERLLLARREGREEPGLAVLGGLRRGVVVGVVDELVARVVDAVGRRRAVGRVGPRDGRLEHEALLRVLRGGGDVRGRRVAAPLRRVDVAV